MPTRPHDAGTAGAPGLLARAVTASTATLGCRVGVAAATVALLAGGVVAQTQSGDSAAPEASADAASVERAVGAERNREASDVRLGEELATPRLERVVEAVPTGEIAERAGDVARERQDEDQANQAEASSSAELSAARQAESVEAVPTAGEPVEEPVPAGTPAEAVLPAAMPTAEPSVEPEPPVEAETPDPSVSAEAPEAAPTPDPTSEPEPVADAEPSTVPETPSAPQNAEAPEPSAAPETVDEQPDESAAEPAVEQTPEASPTSDEPETQPAAAGGVNRGGIVAAAHRGVGSPYVYGGKSYGGWDCSGFAAWAYAQAGMSIPAHTGSMRAAPNLAPTSSPQPGDLVFQLGGSHVGIYLGGGQMVSAMTPELGTQQHAVSDMPVSGYYTYVG